MTQTPEFIMPVDISVLTREQVENIIAGLQDRRLKSVYLYNETSALKEQAEAANLEKQYETKLAKLNTQIGKIDKLIEAIKKAENEVNILRMMLNKEPIL